MFVKSSFARESTLAGKGGGWSFSLFTLHLNTEK